MRNGISSLEDSFEHLQIEVKGKNKKLPYLIGDFYQPYFKNAKKIEWIGKQTQFCL